MSEFFEGDKVCVSETFFWAQAATGTIAKPPSEVISISGEWSDGLTQEEESALGTHTVYWVVFDSPQFDADGDGPYRAGCIWKESLALLARRLN